MLIRSLELSNFRNCDSAKFVFDSGCNLIKGKNHIGKTNVLEAMCWVLTGKLLDGSSDFDSLLPLSNKRATVDVIIQTQDGHTIEKTYAEKYTCTRGSSEETFTGHVTTYTIDGIRQKTEANATSAIKAIIAGNQQNADRLSSFEIDMFCALVNPFYLTEQVDWRKLRSFIISLVGSVTDDDVFSLHPEFSPIKEKLVFYKGRTDLLRTFYMQKLNELRTTKKANEISIDTYSSKTCPSKEDYAKAKAFNEWYENGVKTIENTKRKDRDKERLPKDKEFKTRQASDLRHEIDEEEKTLSKQYYDRMSSRIQEQKKLEERKEALVAQKENLISEKKRLAEKLEMTKRILEDEQKRRSDLALKWKEEKIRPFEYKEIHCPKCNAVVNEKEEEEERALFESDKRAKLDRIVENGNASKEKCDGYQLDIVALTRQLAECDKTNIADLDAEIEKTKDAIQSLGISFDSNMVPKSARRVELEKLTEEINALKDRIRQWSANSRNALDGRLIVFRQEHAQEYTQSIDTVNAKVIYEDAQKSIEDLRSRNSEINKEIMDTTDCKNILDRFVTVKLGMINASTEKVFPDIRWTMITSNIKEGSFNEVCFPKILGKDTPYANGSGAEKILTNVAIREDILRYLGIGTVPLLIDEGETLDTDSLSGLKTDSQIIATVVSNEFETPEVTLLA